MGLQTGVYLVYLLFLLPACRGQSEPGEDPPYDGWFNNLIHPDWGAADTQLLRMSPQRYEDGVYKIATEGRPNALDISTKLHSGVDGLTSTQDRTAFMVFFGQQIVEEIVDSQRQGCPPEHIGVPVPDNHKYHMDDHVKSGLEMPMRRTRFDQSTGYSPNVPRQQLNEITPFIDGNVMYGPLKAWTDAIRSYTNGTLKAADDSKPIKQSFPTRNTIRLPFANPPEPRGNAHRPVNRFYTIGNPRGNENPFLLGLGIMWFRYHNYVAGKVKDELEKSGAHEIEDEFIFNEARKRVIAQYQKIIFQDWLPGWLGPKRPRYADQYTGYKPNVHPGISQEFQTAAMRYGHTLIPTSVRRFTNSCKLFKNTDATKNTGKPALRLCNTFWNSDEAVNEDLGALFLGMASSPAAREDNIVSDDVRLNVFGPREFTRRDLVALNIMRGRDHGVADYNTVREVFGLPRHTNFSDAFNDSIAAEAIKVYGDINKVDLFTGGLLETDSDGPGELFSRIMYEQFVRIRDGDRFWYENFRSNGLFDEKVFYEIGNTTIRDVILAVIDVSDNDLQKDPFSMKGNKCSGSGIEINDLEDCTPLDRYDYFSNSEVSFTLTFLFVGIFIVATILALFLLGRKRQKSDLLERNKRARTETEQPGIYSAMEWLGPKTGERKVFVTFDSDRKKILVQANSAILRMLDLRKMKDQVMARRSTDGDKDLIIVRVPKESDLVPLAATDRQGRQLFPVLRFPSSERMTQFSVDLKEFVKGIGCRIQESADTTSNLMKTAVSKESRQKVINNVIKAVCLQAFGANKKQGINQQNFDEVIPIQLTKSEFAEVLSLQPNSLFVRNMFWLIDKDNNGYLTFREFLDMFVVFAKGSAEKKTRLMFDMYDVRKVGYLRVRDFKDMIKSMLELGNANLAPDQIDTLCDNMLQGAGMANKNEMQFEDFTRIFSEHSETIGMATLNLQGVSSDSMPQEGRGAGNNNFKKRLRKTIIKYGDGDKGTGDKTLTRKRPTVVRLNPVEQQEVKDNRLTSLIRFIEYYRLHIFWVTLYTLVAIGIFVERAYYYSVEREHGGLRHIAGYGVTLTRGAASGMMFTYATLLVTMSRNIITELRETFVNRFIPLDSYISFHKYVALLALLFTVVHILGHSINFYHISTQTAIDANCLFREYFRASHVVPSFHYWCFTTVTGITGVILTIIVIVMYVFASQYARRNLFKIFWFTHGLYPLLFIFMIIHGLGRLVQDPLTHYFVLGPIVLFVLDRFMVFRRRSLEISVFQAHILPSDVLGLVFKKPRDFDYRSGQWVRIACLEMSSNEYHPFTLSSAPHEDTLSLHIRAVGPWTKNLHHIYNSNNRDGRPFPRLYLDGPYGEGHQDWYRYDVSVLVGGGIGVTPFASILKDIVYRAKIGAAIQCQKVYFLWVTRTQKHFEWMTDIIRQVEESDGCDIASVHIFITQFYKKFDLRTTMLYICERNFQKVAQKSLFTGLRSVTHFGRPDFYDFLLSLSEEHKQVNQFGVFSCGPPPMTRKVEVACSKLNHYNGPSYHHHYENF